MMHGHFKMGNVLCCDLYYILTSYLSNPCPSHIHAVSRHHRYNGDTIVGLSNSIQDRFDVDLLNWPLLVPAIDTQVT